MGIINHIVSLSLGIVNAGSQLNQAFFGMLRQIHRPGGLRAAWFGESGDRVSFPLQSFTMH